VGFSLIHVPDMHFGSGADLDKIASIENLVPDFDPDVVVLSGNITTRARDGEFQAARLFARQMARSALVYIIPGSNEAEWWRRPLLPMSLPSKFATYRKYFGDELTPTFDLSEALITGALTSHGPSLRAFSARLKDMRRRGYLPEKDVARIKNRFKNAKPQQTRIVVMHHNIVPEDSEERPDLARFERARAKLIDAGTDIVLCGHDATPSVDAIGGVVVSCAGTLAGKEGADVPVSFHRIVIQDELIQVEVYLWEAQTKAFRQTDVFAFSRRRKLNDGSKSA